MLHDYDITWKKVLSDFNENLFFQNIIKKINSKKKQGQIIYPASKNIFRVFNETSFSDIKVVILGQDPYHGINQANGLAFSVPDGFNLPPSLRNIFFELKNDLGVDHFYTGDLSSWANQGVFLLNCSLTVSQGEPMSHFDLNWSYFTDEVIKKISFYHKNVVFVLWGSYAQKKEGLIDKNKHLILKSAHPSPLSSYRGFFGSKPFSQVNDYLEKTGQNKIDWSL